MNDTYKFYKSAFIDLMKVIKNPSYLVEISTKYQGVEGKIKRGATTKNDYLALFNYVKADLHKGIGIRDSLRKINKSSCSFMKNITVEQKRELNEIKLLSGMKGRKLDH